jgi:hypothetical protein
MSHSNARPSRFAFAFALLALASGCAASSDSSSAVSSQEPAQGNPGGAENGTGSSTSQDAERAIVEADIVQVADGKLFAMSKSGTVAIVDVSVPGRLSLLGKIRIPGEPFEMYRRGDKLVAMSNRAFSASGARLDANAARTYAYDGYGYGLDLSAGVVVIDVSNPANMSVLDAFRVRGEIADSRIVGDILYLATYESASCYECSTPRTMLSSFDLKDSSQLRKVDQLSFASGYNTGYNSFTGTAWKRSIMVTAERMYIGGLSNTQAPGYDDWGYTSLDGVIEVVDVRDPNGRLVPGARIPVAGPVLSRWQMDERDGVLRVVSQTGAGDTANGTDMPAVETFRLSDDQSGSGYQALGHTKLHLPRQEGLRAVRFDADRAYAITYENTDPLFVIDLADASKPKQRGELHMPGFVFHMEPRGNQLLGLGVDASDPRGNLNVSLIDVTDMDNPTLRQRVSFGPVGGSDRSAAAYQLPEDQDRIQKAFKVFGDGQGTDLVVVPHSSQNWGAYSEGDACASVTSGVQLIDWTHNSNQPLTLRGNLPLRGQARRAIPNGGELITVSESNVRSFSLANKDASAHTADLQIDECQRSQSYYGGFEGDDMRMYPHWGCSASPRRAGAPFDVSWALGLGLVVVAQRIARRKARA